MKKYIAASALVLLSSFSLMTYAEPNSLTVEIKCPVATSQDNTLQNFGDYVAGYGQEYVQGASSKPIYFKSGTLTNSPDISHYIHFAANYNPENGQVTCTYSNNNPPQQLPPIDLFYTLANGKGGVVKQQLSDSVLIDIPFGLKN